MQLGRPYVKPDRSTPRAEISGIPMRRIMWRMDTTFEQYKSSLTIRM
jgi:hypothetical protein